MEKVENDIQIKMNGKINLNEDIKSIVVLKNIFSFCEENKKFKIMLYNKWLQKKFGIDIECYKKLRGRYFKGDRNGHGQVFILDSNILLFEGEYIDGEINGKGKEFNIYGQLIFEGEYLNCKRNGKGIEYNKYNKYKIYEGEYLNG